MGKIKSNLLRIRLIDRALRNEQRPFPSKLDLRKLCEEATYGSSEDCQFSNSLIEKDMLTMKREYDAPIKYSKSKEGYYYGDPLFTLDDSPLSESDISAIRLATRTLTQFKEAGMFKQMSVAIDKLVERVEISSSNSQKEIDDFVQYETPVSHRGSEFLAPILEQIKAKKIIYFDYQSFHSQLKKRRKVLPILLKEYRNRWYLISHDVMKEAIITYALDRMSDLENSEQTHSLAIAFKSKQFFQHAIGITASNGQPEVVKIKADNVAAKYIDSQPFHNSQKIIKEGKNKTSFELTVFISEELIRAFMSFGGEIEILEPELLRVQIVKRVSEMVNLYK